MGREMPWTILLFASGSLAIPAPSIFLVPPYPSSHDDPMYISCTAPEDFLGANFTLFQGGEVVQLLQAPSNQSGVTFNVTSEAAGGDFRCQYGVLGEHSQPQLSDLSQPARVSFPAKIKNLQKQRERESCWAQINFTNTASTLALPTAWNSLPAASMYMLPSRRPSLIPTRLCAVLIDHLCSQHVTSLVTFLFMTMSVGEWHATVHGRRSEDIVWEPTLPSTRSLYLMSHLTGPSQPRVHSLPCGDWKGAGEGLLQGGLWVLRSWDRSRWVPGSGPTLC
ncbi:protein HIDE1 isoform X1 [Mesocricetus auratus]|uniref:Protein HIDE1 isoform X1 n=1 Tax=Mesocricetus auratus TaxID=10036 RepID=A0ABM2W5W0_MESAU|nr:protein HIDE1 isoform X1 [Mesocricetus auratus]